MGFFFKVVRGNIYALKYTALHNDLEIIKIVSSNIKKRFIEKGIRGKKEMGEKM